MRFVVQKQNDAGGKEGKVRKTLKLTVGNIGADLNGDDNLIIQAAIEHVARDGGGVVEIKSGTYHLFNSVLLHSHIQLIGSGEKTILIKEPSVTVPIVEDTDWYEYRVTVANASAFKVGGGVLLQGRCPHNKNLQVVKHTVRAIDGNTLWLNDQARGYQSSANQGNFWVGYEPTASTLFPLVTAIGATDIGVANLMLDGNRGKSAYLSGNYGGAMYFEDCERVQIQNIYAGHIESDILSFQVVHDLIVEHCVFENAIQGLHPGSGSQRSIIRHNVVRTCDSGLSWCWGVRFGVVEYNTIEDCKVGISIGHRDTDNVMRNNTVRCCSQGGLVYRDDPVHQAADNNVVEGNLFQDIGSLESSGYGVDMSASVTDNILRGNRVVCTRPGLMRAGIRIGKNVKRVVMEDNVVEGIDKVVDDLRK